MLAILGQTLVAQIHIRSVEDALLGVLGVADNDADPRHLAANPRQAILHLLRETPPQQQIIRRIAQDGQLGKHDQIGLVRLPGLNGRLDHLVDVAVDIADPQIELGHADP